MRYLIAVAFLCPLPALADCPATDYAALDAQRTPFFDALRDAEDAGAGQRHADKIWLSWRTAPDAAAQEMLDKGVRRIRLGDYAGAEATLDELVAYCPDFPEGWNQRAFARYLAGNYDGALADLDRTLVLEPRHFAAMAGRGLTFLKQGRTELGHKAIREAVELHPFMNERHLLPPSEKI
ncbi:MAG: tetratricopeptide repeat protein [Pseudomonadota bacterium]